MIGQNADLLLIDVEAVCDDEPRREDAQAVQIADGRLPEAGEALLGLDGRLGQMEVDERVVIAGKVGRPLQQFAGDGVDGVRAEGVADAWAIGRRRGVATRDVAAAALGLFGSEVIETGLAEHSTETHLLDGLGRGVELVIHVEEGRRTAAEHLHAGQLGAPIDVLVRQLRLIRPDGLLEPLHERHVVAVAAEECHGGMRVGVDESGDEGLAAAVDHGVRLGGVDRLGDARDGVAFYKKVRRTTLPFDGPDQYAAHTLRGYL